ncbi:DUF4271 domain-containing protein [Allomuricauda sp. M10]|jgi:hypothetical protein|uniref:DUF4271 domain-containing protein n=1 Tax=Allomuricauda sp. M10 TaxID=2683292 RepID=UPI001D18A67B|nr:DUF4271 domain-containing protein [Muricauda sp. M10]
MNPIEKSITSLDWMTLVLFSGLVLLAIGKYINNAKFLNFIILPFNDKYVLLNSRKGPLLNWFHILMSLFQLLNLSLFIYLVLDVFKMITVLDPIMAFFVILGGLALFELTKLILQAFTGFVFNNQEFILSIIFSKTSYLNYSSLVIALANILLIYVLIDSKTIIYGAIALIIIINGIGTIKLLKNYQKAMFPYFVYFILYLCALEIAPLVLIGSYLKV